MSFGLLSLVFGQIMKLYKTNKSVLQFQNNATQFLNGLTSNDMDKPNNAFLNVHGKIVATFDQIKIDENRVLVIMEQSFVDQALQHIDKYVKLSGIKVETLDHNVYFDLDGNGVLQEGDWAIPQNQGKLIITKHDLDANVSDEEFTVFRLNHHIPLLGKDYHDELLLNVSVEDFVSFTKGCYLGQEPISKVYNRSKPTWKLVVKNEQDCNEEEKRKMTSKTLDPKTGQTLGYVFVRNE